MISDFLRLKVADLTAATLSNVIDQELVKKHVRVDVDDDHTLLEAYTMASVLWCENAIHRSIVSRSHEWVLRSFPVCSPYEIKLPRGKVQSVDSVAYSNSGVTTTLYGPTSDTSPAGTDFQEDLRDDSGAVIMPARGSSWPSVDSDVPSPVVISFTAGWTGIQVPQSIIQAVLFTIADCYDLRGTDDLKSGERFDARWALLSPYMLSRW